MAINVLIVGVSGSGKSTAMRNLPPQTSLCIKSINKRMPFRSKDWGAQTKSEIVTDDYNKVHAALNKSMAWGKTAVILDDFYYLMAQENMRNASVKGYDKFTTMAVNTFDVIKHAETLPSEQRVYFLTHEQESESGQVSPKTVGKLLDQQINLAGLFTIVLRCWAKDGRHYFTTATNGMDCAKSPIGMFEHNEIDNDLAVVDAAIKEYYGLEY